MTTLANNVLAFEEQIVLARRHFERKGYRVHSGLQFGCELVLYADDPDRVHSDFCVHVVSNSRVNWMSIQTLARSMSTLHKQLIVIDVIPSSAEDERSLIYTNCDGGEGLTKYYRIDEIAIASGHAPFKHKKKETKVGEQKKRKTK